MQPNAFALVRPSLVRRGSPRLILVHILRGNGPLGDRVKGDCEIIVKSLGKHCAILVNSFRNHCETVVKSLWKGL